ncbi:MAG: hypothetical protein AAFP19_26715, partial [Bacteroidota bacterium]
VLDGKTFIGLVTRLDGSYESIYQKLPQKLIKEVDYRFHLYLSSSAKYISGKDNFDDPVKLRIWGGISPYRKAELLYESQAINDFNWKRYTISFTPTQDFTYLFFEAYPADNDHKTAGNLLMDAINIELPQAFIDSVNREQFIYRNLFVEEQALDVDDLRDSMEMAKLSTLEIINKVYPNSYRYECDIDFSYAKVIKRMKHLENKGVGLIEFFNSIGEGAALLITEAFYISDNRSIYEILDRLFKLMHKTDSYTEADKAFLLACDGLLEEQSEDLSIRDRILEFTEENKGNIIREMILCTN